MMQRAWKCLMMSLLMMAGVCSLAVPSAIAATDPLPFSVQFTEYNSGNSPTIKVTNYAHTRLTKFEIFIGNASRHFDYVTIVSNPDGGQISVREPSPNTSGDKKTHDWIKLDITDWDHGESFTIRTDIDTDGQNDPQDYRQIMLIGLSHATVEDSADQTDTLYIPHQGNLGLNGYFVEIPRAERRLTLVSATEASASAANKILVSKVDIYVDGTKIYNDVAETNFTVLDGDVVEIVAPQEVYKDIHGNDITDSAVTDPKTIQDEAEERLTAIGISVDNIAQTGDPTRYRFDIKSDTHIVVKWRHEYALSVKQAFSDTVSLEKDAAGNPWAGPLTSWASGNPVPSAKKHWIKKDEMTVAEIDTAVLEFSRPGLDIRYVCRAYVAYGAPNGDSAADAAEIAAATGDELAARDVLTPKEEPLSVGQTETREQVKAFTMYGPGGIDYVWQLQYGVRVNVDDVTLTDLPKIFLVTPTNEIQVASGEGVYWFDPGTTLRIASAANESGPDSTALKGWLSGDGYYFSDSGTIDDTQDGVLIEGGPDPTAGAVWLERFTYPQSNIDYRGLEIAQLRRAVRVLWRYGPAAIADHVFLGEHVFQNDPQWANVFTTEPISVEQISVSGANKTVGSADMTVWDPEAARLYPVVPGIFRATWESSPGTSNMVEALVTVDYPPVAHYPHIADAPPVAVDPDPGDTFIFKSVKYRENDATVDTDGLFTASTPGYAVLLFSELQAAGRGEPREFLRVRVVDTDKWNDGLPSPLPAIIGQPIRDPELDLAQLGTGHVVFEGARYNLSFYDALKLKGIASPDIYDMEALRSTSAEKIVVNPDALPGPIVPVNLHPGATQTDKVVVVWYDDPAENDELMWPHAARAYSPRWPRMADEGLGRIVIASQYGSESLAADGSEQETAPAITNIVDLGDGNFATNVVPASTTFDPSRLQQVQIYSQPDPTKTGYNPNEEHALLAPSLRFADVSPRPQAAYALRDGDLNGHNPSSLDEALQPDETYTSHPFVLVQFFDKVTDAFGMRIYQIVKEDRNVTGYRFADPGKLNNASAPRTLQAEPHVVMEAGEPVIPFYPLGVAIGAAPPAEIFGNNIKNQTTYWEDHRGSSWAISGGDNGWFTHSVYYPLAPDFWWPAGRAVPPVLAVPLPDGTVVARFDNDSAAAVPGTGDAVAFLPADVTAPATSARLADHLPTLVLFKSDWPRVVPILKAGETLTFSGGEYRADHSTINVPDGKGGSETVETPGLPGVLAFATAEVVFDSLNPTATSTGWQRSWTARIAQVLDYRRVPLSFDNFPPDLAPAGGRTRVSQGQYIFNDLPASLQKRVRYDPLNGDLVFFGLLNDKDIGDRTLTASPPAVYVLEPNIMTKGERDELADLDGSTAWKDAAEALYQRTLNPNNLTPWGLISTDRYLVGLEPHAGILARPMRAFGPGLAVVPNAEFLDPEGTLPDGSLYPDFSWVTVMENNDPSLGGSPITPHIIKVDRSERYRGAIKTVLSDNVFDENMVLRHTGDFGADAGALAFEWWYRPDDGSLNVPPPDLIPPEKTNPWMIFPDPTGNKGVGRATVKLKGNPNAPEALLADTWWFVRYRHTNDIVADTDWAIEQPDGSDSVNFTWAGAGNSDPFNDFDADGVKDYRAQLAMGWIKRVLDAVNPYEARIRDFEGDNPATVSSMIAQFGARFEGPVALNPDKNVIENVGLIELYETVLKRGRDLSIDLSRPVFTPAIANALQLASTRIADFYTILGNEAYTDALDPTIGHGSSSASYGSLAPAVFTFQNQLADLIEEELGLLRGVDDYFARPVYNRLFWNFTKGEGEAAYAVNYNVSDVNNDGFIDEDDAMLLYPQGHGDAWGHYLTAVRNQYELLAHKNFNWVSRSEFYNLMDIVMKVDFLDERKFAQTAAARARTGAEIVDLTYRSRYVEEPTAQWQGYTDSLKDRAWGVQGWARRAGQGAYFDWITANALLPSEHPNEKLTGIQKVDRAGNSDIRVVSANLNAIQRTFDDANKGYSPLGVAGDAVPFDLNPEMVEQIRTGRTHFEQIYERAVTALKNASAVWDSANQPRNMLRKVANDEASYRNSVYQGDLSFRNRLIKTFGKPYLGTIGPGKLYPAGYDGPDTMLYMYVDTRTIDDTTVPGPTTTFATFSGNKVTSGEIYDAFEKGQGSIPYVGADLKQPVQPVYLHASVRRIFAPTLVADGDDPAGILAKNGLYAVNYTEVDKNGELKVPLTNMNLPVMAAGYTFQAGADWGQRQAIGDLQIMINKMIQQEAAVIRAIGSWDGLQGSIIRDMRLANAKLDQAHRLRLAREVYLRLKAGTEGLMKAIDATRRLSKAVGDTVIKIAEASKEAMPKVLPTGGVAVSPGDALFAARAGFELAKVGTFTGSKATDEILAAVRTGIEIAIMAVDNEMTLWKGRESDQIAAKSLLVGVENKLGDEPILRVEIFKQIEALRLLSDQYRAMVDQGSRLIDERAAYNKRVAAQTQSERYQDMTFRVARNHALQTYRDSFDLAARYTYLAAKAYDYETNLETTHPGSPVAEFGDIVRARGIGYIAGGVPQLGKGGLAESLAWMKTNFEVQKAQLGIMNPQAETGKLSLRTELFRILPKGASQPVADGYPMPGGDANELWRETLMNARVSDLWMIPEFRYFCRPFASETDGAGGHVVEPGLVFRFGTEITAGKNFFGKPLSGADHAYDPSLFATKLLSLGVWFSDYSATNLLYDLPEAPRVYLVPVGSDVMTVSSSLNPDQVRYWNVVDQRIPVPLPSVESELDYASWIPLIDSLNGRLGEPRRFSSFRAYHDAFDAVDPAEMVTDSRLIGRSVWNTEWLLIIPGQTLNADADEGLDRFIDQVSDIRLVFETYGYSGN